MAASPDTFTLFFVLHCGEAQVVPEPGTYLLLGAGLIGLGLLRRMRPTRQ